MSSIYGQKLTLDDNLSLNRNKCHHPLINQLSAHNIIEVGSDVKRVEVLLSPLPNFLLSNCVPAIAKFIEKMNKGKVFLALLKFIYSEKATKFCKSPPSFCHM